jgi:hypothetical protein
VRGFLAAATVRQLKFDAAADWADLIEAETQKDVRHIVLEGEKVDMKTAKKSATIVSQAIVTHPMDSLEKHAFGEIQNWRNQDEDIVQDLRVALNTANPLSGDLSQGVFAAHLVAAATMSGLAEGGNIALLFSRMLDLLKSMHDKNPSFGPLRVRHAGNLARDRAYIPTPAGGKIATLRVQPERRPERKRA